MTLEEADATSTQHDFILLNAILISRLLWATYIVTPEQKSSGILISELFEARKWVVEKFHGISPGLIVNVKLCFCTLHSCK